MDFNLQGKNALITGSSRGIGKCISTYLKNEGCNISLNSRYRNPKKNIKSETDESFFIEGDVSDPKEAKRIVREFISNFKSLDILICNVGSGQSLPPGEETYEEWQRIMKQNLYSATNIISESRKYLAKNKGSIICISSICGVETIDGAPATYSAAKAALNSYIKSVSRPFANEGIRINGVAPGNILFPGSSWEKKIELNPDKVNKLINSKVPLKKFGTPDDVAILVCYLSSRLSKFVTGSIFKVDGGQTFS